MVRGRAGAMSVPLGCEKLELPLRWPSGDAKELDMHAWGSEERSGPGNHSGVTSRCVALEGMVKYRDVG